MRYKKHLTILLKNTNYIEKSTKFGTDCTIGPCTYITHNSHINNNCKIKNSTIENCEIQNDCTIVGSVLKNCKLMSGVTILNSVLFDCAVLQNATIGPFAHLRQNAVVGQNCRVGDFVEIKNSILADNTKCAHLCYVGDANVGQNCNIGCGCVFANFDGKQKHKTTIGDNCFLGANVNLVAPLKVGKSCFVGAGTTLRKNVDDNTFVVDLVAQKVDKNKHSTT